ncbi:MAG: hypothetical protein U0441_20940 [Polyangiaceae bacterium]
MDVKKTLFQLALAAAGVAAVSVAQAQPAPTAPAPTPAPTTTANPNAPPATPPAAPAPTDSAAPNTPPPPPTAAPTAPPATPPVTPAPANTAPQGDPNAPPPPPPVQPPPVSQQANPTPPPTPFVPPPAPQAQWNPQGGDMATSTEKPKPLRWRGTTLEWYQYANTQYFGVGSPYGGSQDFSYVHLFRFAPQFYLVDLPKDKLTVAATLWGSVEATNSNLTTYKNEFEVRDTPINLKYTRTALQSPDVEGETPEFFTKTGIGGGITLPTSKASIAYRYLALNLSGNVSQQIALKGTKSDLFPNLNVNLSAAYAHAFNKTNVPTGGSTVYQRQDLSGNALVDNQFGKYVLATDTLLLGAALTLPIYKDLTFAASYRYWMRWKPNATDACVQTSTGCAYPEKIPGGATTFSADTILDVSLGYTFFDVLEAAIGYSNWRNSIGESGLLSTPQSNPFYSTEATFYLDLTANIDAIYSKASGRDKKTVAKGAGSSWF